MPYSTSEPPENSNSRRSFRVPEFRAACLAGRQGDRRSDAEPRRVQDSPGAGCRCYVELEPRRNYGQRRRIHLAGFHSEWQRKLFVRLLPLQIAGIKTGARRLAGFVQSRAGVGISRKCRGQRRSDAERRGQCVRGRRQSRNPHRRSRIDPHDLWQPPRHRHRPLNCARLEL